MPRRAVLVSAAIAAGWAVFAIAGYAILTATVPGTTPVSGGLWIIAAIAIVVAFVLAALGWWSSVGFTPPSQWRELGWLVAPTLLAFLPLVTGIKAPEAGSIGALAVGYALTGFAEEAVFRGIILRLLRNRPRVAAVAIAAVLFGLVHLANIFIRGNPAVVAAQAVGAACFGFGYGALRLRTNTLWPLVLTHMLTDLFLQVGKLPLIPVAVVQDILLLLFGFWLLRPGQRA